MKVFRDFIFALCLLHNFVEKDKKQSNNIDRKEKAWWQPVMIFYAKTAGWIMIPLLLGVFLGNYVEQNTRSQALFFGSLMAGFAITCYGIYKEIKQYKIQLGTEERNKEKK